MLAKPTLQEKQKIEILTKNRNFNQKIEILTNKNEILTNN